MSDQIEKRHSWLAVVFESALKHAVFRPAEVIAHATPELLAQHLPKELQVRLLEAALETGKMTPEGILGVAPPATLAKHLSPTVMWQTVRDAAARHGISGSSNVTPKSGKTPLRTWITEVLASGLEQEVFAPADVTRHIPPAEWVREVPLEVVSKMIAAGLNRSAFDPRLALEHLTPQVIGEFISPRLSWAIIDEGAAKAFELGAAAVRPSKPSTPSAESKKASEKSEKAEKAEKAAAEKASDSAAVPTPVATPEWSAEAVDSWVDTDESAPVATPPPIPSGN